jgi:hypothetical protein
MRSIRRLLDDPLAIVIIIIMSFILMVLSIYPIKVKEISVSPFFVFDIIPWSIGWHYSDYRYIIFHDPLFRHRSFNITIYFFVNTFYNNFRSVFQS